MVTLWQKIPQMTFELATILLILLAAFGFSFAIYVTIALIYDERVTVQANVKEEENLLLATDRVIHCWEDHPDAPLECICNSGSKKAGEPCVLNRH